MLSIKKQSFKVDENSKNMGKSESNAVNKDAKETKKQKNVLKSINVKL